MPGRFDDAADPLLARLCAAGGVLMLTVLMASAALRLGQAGCIDGALPSAVAAAARMIHRIAASLVGLLVLAVAWRAWQQRLLSRAVAIPLSALAAATAFLAMLGRASAGSVVPLVIVGNVVAGVIVYVLFSYLQLQFAPRVNQHFSSRHLTRAAAVTRSLAGVQIWLGAWVAGIAAGSGCSGLAATAAWSLQLPPLGAFDPLTAPAGTHAAAAVAAIRVAHVGSALAVLLFAVPLAVRMRQLGGSVRGDANLLFTVLGAQAVLGTATLFVGAMPWSGVAHNVLAAILLGLLVRIHAGFQRI